MKIIYTCPVCGADLQCVMLTSNPPQERYECYSCGWHHTEEKEDIVRIPYIKHKKNIVDLGDGWSIQTSESLTSNACKNCSNNPNNGGSGICHCILGIPTIY